LAQAIIKFPAGN